MNFLLPKQMFQKFICYALLICLTVGLSACHGKNMEDSTLELTEDVIGNSSTTVPQAEVVTKASDAYGFKSFRGPGQLDVPVILQNPEFPTGCEATALAMVLSYISRESIDLHDFIFNYLPMNSDNFVYGYTGDPTSHGGGGTYPPCIVSMANAYMGDHGISLRALDATGIKAGDICKYIDRGFPVIIWTTYEMTEPKIDPEKTYQTDHDVYVWYTIEHCVVITGYDLEKNVFYINDPLHEETIERDITEFMEIADAIGNLAVVIL